MPEVQSIFENERLNLWQTRANKMHAAKSHYSQHWDDYERTWKMFKDERVGEDSWRANLPETFSFATIKTAQAAFVDSRVEPIFIRHEETDRIKASDMHDLYVDIADKGNIDSELYQVRLDSFKLGTGFLKTTYVEDKRTINAIESFDAETGKIKYREDEIKDFDAPKTQRVSPWLMLVDEMARFDVDTARYMMELEILGKQDAKRIYGHLDENFDENVKSHGQLLSLMDDISGSEVANTADTNTALDTDSIRFFAPFELEEDYVVVWHCWDKTNDTYEIFANGYPLQIKTEEDPSPIPYIHKQLPYIPLRYSPYSGDEFWGAGIIEIGRADAQAMEKYKEMMVDRQKLALFSPAFTDVDDEIDQRSLIVKPLSLIPTRGGTPTQWQIPGIDNGDLEVQNLIEEGFKKAVGIDERVLGISPEGARLTATEVSFLREAALRRLREFAFLYKDALKREVKLKLSLFKQYYSSPLSREEHVKGDEHIKGISVEFKSRTGNVYKRKSASADLFNEEFDIDIEMRVLVPMTKAQLITKWSQLIRDTAPVAGQLGIDVEKLYDHYYEAFDERLDAFKEDSESEPIKAAEAEHRLLADDNTTDATAKELDEGTPPQFLSAQHLKRHRDLLRNETDISDKAMRNIAKHIAKDTNNLRKKAQEEAQNMAQNMQQVGGMGQGPQLPPRPPEERMTPQPDIAPRTNEL